jgi:hypothetical protein
LHRVSFFLPSYFHDFVLALIKCLISQALALLEKQRAERAIESAQIAKNAELEVLVRPQAEKITELETAYTNLKCEKENVTTRYRRLVAKHGAFVEKVEQEKVKLVEAARQRLLSLIESWIWRCTTTRNTIKLCFTCSASFTRQWLHRLMKSKHSVYRSPTNVRR